MIKQQCWHTELVGSEDSLRRDLVLTPGVKNLGTGLPLFEQTTFIPTLYWTQIPNDFWLDSTT